MFDKSFDLTITKDYVSNWGMVHAIRELIQNALDSESPFVYGVERDEEGALTLMLRSEFTTLSPQTLLLGSTSKKGDEHAIGSFGEGYKIALLVLTRLGFKVEMLNGEVKWVPVFRYSRRFKGELLTIDETPIGKPNVGLTVLVHGLSNDDMVQVIGSCLKMQENIGRVTETCKGQILHDQPGKIYVGSLFICDAQLRYGYNFNPGEVALERDRQTIGGWDLKVATLAIWLETGENDNLAKMIDDGIPDVEYGTYGLPDLVKEACYQLFRKRHPKGAIASNQKELEQMVEAGMTVVVGGSATMYHAVSSAPSYRAEVPRVRQAPPTEQILDWVHQHRKIINKRTMLALDEIITKSKDWRAI